MMVLIAEDDAVTQRTLEQLLHRWGYQTISVADGEEASKILALSDGPSLAILDWHMPKKSGIEICSELRANTSQRYIYTIMLTGQTDKQSMVEALKAGADDFISKPFDSRELKVRLRAGERIVKAGTELRLLNETLESRILERTRELNHALKTAENVSEMKSGFLANMSHEIRTPLNGIVSYVELLLNSNLNDEQREDLLTIRSCVSTLRTIINDILDFSKIEAGKMLIDHTPFKLRESLNEVVNILQLQLEQTGEGFFFECDSDVPNDVVGDRVRIQQIITNLLGNAIKFRSERGFVMLHISRERDLGENTLLRFSVIDNGIGIPADKLDHIFDSFSQADASTTRKFGGTGLGLTICKQLSALMGGKIEVFSKEGLGSAFHLLIPLQIRQGKNEIRNKAEVVLEQAQPPKGTAQKILIAEDNQINQKAILRILEKAGYNVVTASTGREALEKIDPSFDLILMDIQMPDIGGEEATRKLLERADEVKDIPIVGLTANVLKSDRDKYIMLGMKEIVSKPIDFDQLFKVLRSFPSRDRIINL